MASQDITRTYLKELRNRNSNTEQARNLAIEAKTGCKASMDMLVMDHALLVVKIARTYRNMGVPLNDLIQEGNIGLIDAVEKYDPERGSFASCARQWIKARIIRNCLNRKGVVHLPENVTELMRTNRWAGPNYRESSIDLQDEDGNTLGDRLAAPGSGIPFADEESEILRQRVEKLLASLGERDAGVMRMIYGIGCEPMEIDEIAARFGLSDTRVKQIRKTSEERMREAAEEITPRKEILIISAIYGEGDVTVDVTEVVTRMYEERTPIVSGNRLGGDPCPGVRKTLRVCYYQEGEEQRVRCFQEGSTVRF